MLNVIKRIVILEISSEVLLGNILGDHITRQQVREKTEVDLSFQDVLMKCHIDP